MHAAQMSGMDYHAASTVRDWDWTERRMDLWVHLH